MAGYNEDVNINLNILAGAMGGITAIAGGMSALTSTFGQFGTTAVDSFGTVEGLLVSATALIGAFGLGAAEAAGEFEQSMKIVQAVSGQTSAAVSQLGQEAKSLSVEYRTAIGDITEGLQTLGRAGLNSADSQLEVLESGLQTAKLEGRNLNGVLEELIQNTAMLGGNLDALDFGSQTEYVNSLMVGTSMSAPIDTHDISQTLQYVGGTAAAAGANLEDKEKLEDLMGTIAAFAQKGVKGSMAGTALRAFLTKPASQDTSVVEGLGAIGLSPEDLWEQGGESMKDISDQIELIQHQMDKLNLSTMDQLEIWGKIVGPKMGQQMMKLEADKIEELTTNIQEASSAEELAASTLQSYNQKVNEMGQLGEAVFRDFGTKILTFLTPVVDVINAILKVLDNPVVNTVVFGALLALVSHGLQAAYRMIMTIVNQVRTAIAEITGGIEGTNGAFNRTISSAGALKNELAAVVAESAMLNSNIARTDTLMGAAQAQMLGKAGSKYIPGFGRYRTEDGGSEVRKLPSNVVGISDNYQQYFKKDEMGRRYSAYYRENPIPESRYQELSKQGKKLFQRIGDDIVPKNPKGLISKKDYLKLNDEDRKIIRQLSRHKIINQKEYDRLDPRERKQYTPYGDPYVRKLGGDYIPTQQYQALDKKDQENYRSKNYRLMAHSGTFEQMERQIEASTSKLRIFDEEWDQLSDSQKKATEDFRKAKAQELKDSAMRAGKDALGRDIYGYTTMHNIPKPRTLADMMSAEGANKSLVMNEAYIKQASQQMRQQYMQSLGIGGRLKVSGLEKLGATVDLASRGFRTLGSGLNTARNRLNTFGTQLNTAGSRLKTFVRDVNLSGTSLRQGIRRTVQSIRAEDGRLRTSLRNIGTSLKATLINGVGWSALEGVKVRLSLFGAQLGFSTATLQNLQAAATAQMAVMSDQAVTAGSVNALVTQLAQKLGVSDQQMAKLIMSSDKLSAAFNALADQALTKKDGNIGGTLGDISKQGGKLSGAFGSLIGMMGGPFSAALMGVTVLMQAIQGAQQAWQKEMQEATTQLKEATSNMEEAANNIKEVFKKENPNATEAQLEEAVDEQYASISEVLYRNSYDENGVYKPVVTGHRNQPNLDDLGRTTVGDGIEINADGVEEAVEGMSVTQDENVKALNENTVALAEATYAYNQAQNKTVDKMTDAVWGMNSYGSNFTDKLGDMQEALWNVGSWNEGVDRRAGFLDNNAPVLTGSQKADDYGGSKEFAGVFAADVYRFGTEQGLRQFFGSDYDRIISLMSSIDASVASNKDALGSKALETLNAHANNFKPTDAGGNLDYQTAALMQTQLSTNKKGYQRLGRLMFNYEKQYGFSPSRTAYADWSTGYKTEPLKGNRPGKKQDRKPSQKISVQDKKLQDEIKKLRAMSGNKLSEANVLAMGQLQQMQDMYQIANEQVAPGIMQTVQQTAANVMATQGAAANAGTASSGAQGAAANAQAIAAFLGAQAQGAAEKAAYDAYKRDPDPNHKIPGVTDQDSFVSKIASLNTDAAKYWRGNVYASLGGTAYAVNNPGASPNDIKEAGQRLSNEVQSQQAKNHTNYQDALNTLTKPIVYYAQGAVMAAYEQSNIGGYGSSSNPSGSGGGGGGGGGSGGGSGDSDKGTKKNRVDLVLCNKKEIPKLNVNLFKKEPNFTVLNKNFKLRDIKINTKDTPKSILTAVKNGLIDTAKRMDPKIIQDEEGEYDPTGATEGKDTPSGTTPSSSE